MLTPVCFGALKPNGTYQGQGNGFRWIFSGTSTQRDAVPDGVWTPTAGDVWWNTATNTMTVNNGSTWASFTGGGTTLDGAYDYGGAGSGRTIAVTDGAVQLTNTDNDTASILGITYSGNTTGDGITITMSVGSGDGIEFENTGSGADIEGTGATWSASKTGAFICSTLAPTGVTTIVTDLTLDCTTDAGKDVEWDDSRETFHFLDNAILGLGGATTTVGDITFTHNGTNLLIEAATQDNTPVHWGSTNSVDFIIYDNAATGTASFNSGNATLELNAYDLQLQDGDFAQFGDDDDFTVTNSGTGVLTWATLLTDNTASMLFGGDQDGFDVTLYGATASTYVEWDATDDELSFILADLKITEGSQIEFVNVGDGATDWAIDIATDETLLFLPTETTDDQIFAIGNATNTSDFRLFGATASTVAFDASADMLTFDAYDITMGDNDIIGFGDSAAEGTIASDATGLNVTLGTSKALNFLRATAGTVNFGADNIGLDVVFFGEAASQKVWWDQSGDEWFFGADAEGVDVTFYGDTASSFAKWDENANTNGALIFDAADIEMGDGDFVQYGDGADLTVSATGTTTTMLLAAGSVLTIADTDNAASLLTFGTTTGNGLDVLFLGATAGDIVDWDAGADTWNFGVDATGVDVYFYGDTTLFWMLWDETNNVLSFDGGNNMLEFRGATSDAHETTLATVEPTGSNILTLADDTGGIGYIPTGSTTKDATDAALPITHAVVIGTSDADSAWSLPDGNPGQVLSVIIGTDGGEAIITPDSTTGDGWATMVFTNDGEGASFMFVDATVGWVVLGTFGISTNPLITGE